MRQIRWSEFVGVAYQACGSRFDGCSAPVNLCQCRIVCNMQWQVVFPSKTRATNESSWFSSFILRANDLQLMLAFSYIKSHSMVHND